jgi:hypothetical protein
MTNSIQRDEPPRNANTLAKWLDEAATASGIAAGRLRRQLGFMVLAAILDDQQRTGPVLRPSGI